MHHSRSFSTKSVTLTMLVLLMVSWLLPSVAVADCTPSYGIKWVKRTGPGNTFKTTDELQSSPDINYFDKNLPTMIYIHGGIALLNLEDVNENAQAAAYMTTEYMDQADIQNAGILRSWTALSESAQYNLAFFDWKEFSIDHYHRLTAKIWGDDSQNWDDFSDPMRYWCSSTNSFSNLNAPSTDIESMFSQQYLNVLYLYGNKKYNAQISIIGNSMGSHVANRFAAAWRFQKLTTASRLFANLPVPKRVILTDPVLHMRHLEIQDLKDGVLDMDLSIIDKYAEKYQYSTQSPYPISMEIIKTTMPAIIENTNADPFAARNRYHEMVKAPGPGSTFQVFSNHPHPQWPGSFDNCVSNEEYLRLRWDDQISPEFMDSFCGWKTNHVRPLYIFFLKELFVINLFDPEPLYDLCSGTALEDFGTHDYIRYVPPGIPNESNDGCFEFCNIDEADSAAPYANPIDCTSYNHQEYFGYSDVVIPGTDTHPNRCGYNDERWMLGMHSGDWENGDCGAIRYPDRYAGGEQNSQLLLGTDMGISVFIPNNPLYGGNNVTIFYMGDSWAKDGLDLADPLPNEWCSDDDFTCHENAVRNDAVAFTFDNSPEDGIDAYLHTKTISDDDQPETFTGMAFPAVHGTDTWDYLFWENEKEWRFTGPAGAVVVPHAFGYDNVIVSWYLTAGFPTYIFENDGCSLDTTDCDEAQAGKRPASWAAFSVDGLSFQSLYQNSTDYLPFSKDGFEWSNCDEQEAVEYSFEKVGKFIGLSPMYVSHDDLKRMCLESEAYDEDSPMCHPAFLADHDGGILAYGTGRPATKSPLYLVYIPINELDQTIILESETVPKAYYFNGIIDDNDPTASWSHYESDAAPLPHNYWGWNSNMGGNPAPCDTADEFIPFDSCADEELNYAPENCFIHLCSKYLIDEKWIIDCYWNDEIANSREQNVFGLMSSRIVRNEGNTTWNEYTYEQPIVFLLYNETSEKSMVDVYNGDAEHYARTIRSRSATLSRPWNFSLASDPLLGLDENGNEKEVDGYGPFIMDRFTAFDKVNKKLVVWYVNSSWDPTMGSKNNSFPYGVYTRKNTFDWPPTDLPGF